MPGIHPCPVPCSNPAPFLVPTLSRSRVPSLSRCRFHPCPFSHPRYSGVPFLFRSRFHPCPVPRSILAVPGSVPAAFPDPSSLFPVPSLPHSRFHLRCSWLHPCPVPGSIPAPFPVPSPPLPGSGRRAPPGGPRERPSFRAGRAGSVPRTAPHIPGHREEAAPGALGYRIRPAGTAPGAEGERESVAPIWEVKRREGREGRSRSFLASF